MQAKVDKNADCNHRESEQDDDGDSIELVVIAFRKV